MDVGAWLPVAFRGMAEAEAFVEAVCVLHPGSAGEDEGGAAGVARVLYAGAHERTADAVPLLLWRDGKDAQFGFVGAGDFLPAAAGQGAGEGADGYAVLSRDEYQRLLRALGGVRDFDEVGAVRRSMASQSAGSQGVMCRVVIFSLCSGEELCSRSIHRAFFMVAFFSVAGRG